MSTIDQIIAKAHYVATDPQVEQLAARHWENASATEVANATFLRITVARVHSLVGTTRRKLPEQSALEALENAYLPLYEAVLRGVVTTDIADNPKLERRERQLRALERNRRSAFARSTKATLVAYVKAGGDVRTLDVDTVTKGALRKFVADEREPTTPLERFQRARAQMLKALIDMAKENPAQAGTALDEALRELHDQVGTWKPQPSNGAAAKRAARTRVGTPLVRQ